jgi:predicted MFS family arabinose efflux permease
LSHQLGSATGAFVPGLLFDRTGSYQSSLLMASAALMVATTLSFWIRERRGIPTTAAAG